MKLRAHLALLVMAVVVPMLAFAVLVLLRLDSQQRTTLERGAVETARALINATDRELLGQVGSLEMLATAASLARGDLPTFYEDARRALASQPDWTTVILAERSGQQVMNVLRPLGSSLPLVADRESVDAVVKTGEPAIGNLTVRPLTRRHDFEVRVPVRRDGAIVYVLTAAVKPASLLALLDAQRLPAEWVASVFDADRVIVARTKANEQFHGGPLSGEFMRILDTATEGWAPTHTLEGVPVYTAFSRSARTRWGVGIGIPQSAVEGPLRRSLWTLAGGGIAFLAAAILTAVVVGRRITRPIVALASAARSLPYEGMVEVPRVPSGVEEVERVARAFVESSAELRTRSSERDEALAIAERARAQAEAASRAKDEFLAVLSHELRTPLNAVYGWARVLRTSTSHADPAAIQRGLDVIERNAQAQVRLIEDLLDVSRIVSGKMRLDLRPVQLAPVIEAALDAVRPGAAAKGVRLQVQLEPGLAPVLGDADRLQQVVWNLLSNAIKFTPKDGRVQVHLRRAGTEVEISVSDTGLGIDAATLPFVFDRFRQADSTSSRAFGGLGLGLALVRHLVELHGGTVTASSAGAGQGATFVVTLPLNITPAVTGASRGVPPTTGAAAATTAPIPLAGIRVLAIDDAQDSLDLVGVMLRSAGAEVRTRSTATQALAAVEEAPPDVILCDLEMPGEDGFSFVRRLRALPPGRGGDLPIAALTAYGRPEDRVRSLAAGFDMHVPKPVDPAELTAVVAVLARRVR
jgi:signal transduction histidine kinase